MFLSKSFVKTVLTYIFVAFFHITYLFFNDWYIFGPQLTARTKKTEKIFPFPLIFPFQVHFFFTHEVPKCGLVVIFQYKNYSRSLFCPLIYGRPLYTHFSLLFPAPGSESHIFRLLGAVGKSLGSLRYGDYGLYDYG